MAKIVSFGEFIGPGEKLTAAYLEKNLPDSWVVICNKELVRPDSIREIDFIIVAEHTVFAVEEKHWHGVIHGNEASWVVDGNESRASPLMQIEIVAKRLDALIRDYVPELKQRTVKRICQRRVLMSVKDATLSIDDPRVAIQVLYLDGCEEDFKRTNAQEGAVASISDVRDRIIGALTSLPDRPSVPRRVDDYEIVETLPAMGSVRCLRGRHSDGSERILRLVPRPTTPDTERYEREANFLLREYTALKKLGELGLAPRVDPYFSWDDDQYWVFPIHVVEGRSLNADQAAAAPDEPKIRRVVSRAFEALGLVQIAGVIHRGLDPDRIYLTNSGGVIFSDFFIARLEGEASIADDLGTFEPDNAFVAPECRPFAGAASAASDVFGLAASLWAWAGADAGTTSLGSSRGDLDGNFRRTLEELLTPCLAEKPAERPTLDALLPAAAALVIDAEPAESMKSADPFEPGSLIEDQYRIVRRLSQGATSVTYLADDVVADSQFVLKVIQNPELAARLAKAEFKFLMDLNHDNLPRVFDIRPPASKFHLKLEYVSGLALTDLMSSLRGRRDEVVRIGEQVLAALEYIQGFGRMHRDISPSNIMVPEVGPVKLIDFGLATLKEEALSAVGTPRYRAPEIDSGGVWSYSCDTYALAAVLYELLTGSLPYETGPAGPEKLKLRPVTEADTKAFGRPLLDVLLRAVSPDPSRRFRTASDFALALSQAVAAPSAEPAAGEPLVNPTVNALRALYRNSSVGNADNRGLDSQFAMDTYVPTSLDIRLLPQILEGKYSLVVLSGNPGDGKTAFLQQLAAEIKRVGGVEEASDEAGWRYKLGGRTIAALFDASESHENLSADDLLRKVLEPLSGEGPANDTYTAAVAANDGRLLDFFEREGGLHYWWLWDQLRPQVYGEASSESRVHLIDLKRRALATMEPGQPSLFSRILDEFTTIPRWEVCAGCAARRECPILANATSLRDHGPDVKIRNGLRDLLVAVHLRRDRRPTLRDLRSTLAYLITHDLGCEDVHAERVQGIVPMADQSRLYFSSAFDGEGSPDLLLDFWRDLDPASVAAPRLDRFFFFHRSTEQSDLLKRAFIDPAGRTPLAVDHVALSVAGWMSHLKRRFYFEGASATGDDHVPAIGAGENLLVYRHFAAFVAALQGKGDDEQLLTDLLVGISLADGAPLSSVGGFLALRVTEEVFEALQVIKRFPQSEFRIRRADRGSGLGEEILQDQLALEHSSGAPTLLLNLDLFELIGRAGEGYLPGAEEQRALGEDLTSFKNQLLSKPTHEVVVMEAGLRVDAVRVEDGRIVLERVPS